jgi:hypothetical protein
MSPLKSTYGTVEEVIKQLCIGTPTWGEVPAGT